MGMLGWEWDREWSGTRWCVEISDILEAAQLALTYLEDAREENVLKGGKSKGKGKAVMAAPRLQTRVFRFFLLSFSYLFYHYYYLCP